MKKSACSIVHVTWLDHSATNSGWQAVEKAESKARPVTIRSVGFVLRDEADYFVLGETLDDTPPHYSGSQRVILKSDIKEMKVLVKNATVQD